MNYENDRVIWASAEKEAAIKSVPHDSRHNAVFETFEEFSKSWKNKRLTIKTE